jgi:superfamily II DNA or RNA helicase
MIEESRNRLAAGIRKVLFQLPTGGGKTVIAAEIIRRAVARNSVVHFYAHRTELIQQCSNKLLELGIDHGIIQGGHWRWRPSLPVQVASVQTLINRTQIYPPNIIFVDECHRAVAKTYQDIIARYPRAVILGLTATPVRSDGRGLGGMFDSMICGPSIVELTEHGFLVPTRVFAPSAPDLQGVKKQSGDYQTRGLTVAMDKPAITGDIVKTWYARGENRQTICFAVSIEHSKHLRDKFREAGIVAEHLDGKTPDDQRRRLLEAVASGEIRVLCSVGVLTEGWDCPAVSCAILARPTCSTGLYLQMVGRILRPHPGKTDALILDHAGCTAAHGFVDAEREWQLEQDAPLKPRMDLDTSLQVKACPKCYRMYSKTQRRCECGYIFHTESQMPRLVAGELKEIKNEQRRLRMQQIPEDRKRAMYTKWESEADERGYRSGYAYAKYRAMFMEEPKREWREWRQEIRVR